MKQGLVSKAETEFKVVQELRDLLAQLNQGLWKAGSILYEVRQRKGYKALGYESFEDYCEGELDRSGSAVNQLLRAYEVAVLKYSYKVEELPDPSKVYIIAEVIEENPDQRDEWMEKAKHLTASDLRKEKKGFKYGSEKCDHDGTEIMVLEKCGNCKEQWRRYDLESKVKKFAKKSKPKSVKKSPKKAGSK